jgi:Leucine-rich repeat (LRR) protein
MLLLGSAYDGTAQSRMQDSLALVDLYNATNGTSWRVSTNWLVQGQPIQNWYGISVDGQGRVSIINLSSNNLQGSLPTTMSNWTNLINLNLKNNQLRGRIPNFTLRRLLQLDVSNNQLTGSVPDFIADTLQTFHFFNNQIDSLPNLSRLRNLTVFRGDSNRLTFDDILPNLPRNFQYAPQDSISRETTISKLYDEPLTIPLGIDSALTTNVYKWFKNGTLYRTTNFNRLIFNNLVLEDAGVYTCQVTNPMAPNLILYSRKITLKVACGTVFNVPVDTTLCAGRTYTAPSGRVISTAGTYLDTLIFYPVVGCRMLQYVITVRNDSSCRCLDSIALVGLYNATGGATTWANRTNWLSTNPIQTWYGINMNAQGCVSQIILNVNGLNGNVPNLSLSKLSALSLEYNQLRGRIPNFNLPNLATLSLAGNQLTDTIPNFNFPNLQSLYLHSNQLSGKIPNWNFSNLQHIFVHSNQLIGSIPNFNLPKLQTLWVNSNRLTGNIPNFNSRLLVQLDVSNNQLTGSVPNFRLDSLRTFHFYNNRIDNLPNLSGLLNLVMLTGDTNRLTFDDILPNLSRGIRYTNQDSIYDNTIIYSNVGDPLSIHLGIDSTLASNRYKWFKNGTLYRIDSSNQFIINNLQITDAGIYTCQVTNRNAPLLTLYSRKITVIMIPTCRARDSLALMDLYGQNVTLPTARAQLNNWLVQGQPIQNWYGVTLNPNGCVNILDLGNIGLTRRLTNSIGDMTQLEELYLQNNNLDGTLPNSMSNLILLKTLLLSNNLVSGLPDSIEKMVRLRELDLDDNLLTGNIPTNLGLLSRMRLLKLSNNDFTGKIPSNLGNLANLQDLNLSDNQLSDSIPSSLGNLLNLKKLYLDRNRLTGKIPNSFQQLSVLTEFNFGSNDIDSLINLSSLPNLTLCDTRDNRLTFDDILPNLGKPYTLIYAPQDTIFEEKTYNRSLGEPLTIDLRIDSTLTSNVYKWFKNGTPMDMVIRSNKLIFNRLSRNDVGIYTCEVRDSLAPNLVLYSRKATVNMHCTTTVTKTESVCNASYVGTSVVVTHDANSTTCDSLVTITHRVFDKCTCLQDSTIIYNGLIPNDGDNQNDFFVIPLGTQYLPNELIITDKRGMLIYQAKDYQNNWTGTNQKGEPLPEGVYNFVFRTMNPNCMRMGVIDIKYIP